MINDTNTTTTSETAGEGTKKNGNGHKVDAYLIPFTKIEVSKWNRSCGIAMDDDYIKSLADDIKRNGLLHPVTLVKTADGEGYRIVAGANRVAALRKMRGDNSGLKQTEFKVREDMDEDDKGCLEISLSENHHRRESSVYEQAVYVDRLIDEQKLDQGKVATLLKFDRPKVNRLQKLAKEFSKLPECWQTDLKTSPSSANAAEVVVTFTHWYEVAGAIGDEGELTPKLLETLMVAHDENYSTRQLRSALETVVAGGDAPKRESTGKTVKPPSALSILKRVLEGLRAAAGVIKGDRAGDAADLDRFANVVEGIVTKLDEAKKEKARAEKKAKAAAAPGTESGKGKGKGKKGKGKGAEAQNATAQAA